MMREVTLCCELRPVTNSAILLQIRHGGNYIPGGAQLRELQDR